MKFAKIIDNGVTYKRMILLESIEDLIEYRETHNTPIANVAFGNQFKLISSGKKIAINQVGGYMPLTATAKVKKL